MTIGEKIKALRKQNDVTQEKLADYLNISYQSVSKWENNAALPDISLVVPLANFFGVTTDALFGVEVDGAKRELEKAEAKYRELHNRGEIRECLELCRAISAKYPRNYEGLYKLAHMLIDASFTSDFTENERASAEAEGLSVGERLMEDCADEEILSQTRGLLVCIYDRRGNADRALSIARQAPSMYYSWEILSDLTWCADKTRERRCANILELTNLLTITLTNGRRFNIKDAIKAYEAALTIWNAVVDDGNFLYYHHNLRFLHCSLASLYADGGDAENTLRHLEKALYHAEKSDAIPASTVKYSGTFINGMTYNPTDSVKNYTETAVELFRKQLAEKRYDFIRGEDKFSILSGQGTR